jgi:hypothetical protein
MRCRTARRKLLELELGAPARPAEPHLARHLARCAECAAERRVGAMLAHDLRSLRTAAPFEVDVRAAVLRAVATSAPAGGSTPALDRRTLGWLAAGLAALFAASAWGVFHVRALAGGAVQGWSIAAAFGRVLLHCGRVWGLTLKAALHATVEWLTAAATAIDPAVLGISLRSLSLWAAFVLIVLTAVALLYDVRRGTSLSDQEPLT